MDSHQGHDRNNYTASTAMATVHFGNNIEKLQFVLLSLYSQPLHVSTRVGHLQGAQCQCLAEVIND
jgi:hypothetical protein